MRIIKTALPLLVVFLTGTMAMAASSERYLHIRVNNLGQNEQVRVNVPLSFAEKVLPAINHGQLSKGKLHIGKLSADSVDMKAIFEALKTAPEGEFVTVRENDNDVRVAKEHGQLIVRVVDKGSKDKENVEVTIPWNVALALSSEADGDQLNLEAAIKALESAGDITLVAVTSREETVRIWIDSSSTADQPTAVSK
jgi:ribonuclease HI